MIDPAKQFGPLTAADWYWRASDGRIFSSDRIATVPSTDSAFLAWCGPTGEDQRDASRWPRDETGAETVAALQDVLTPFGLFASLVAYANTVQWRKAIAGYTAQVAGAPVTFSTQIDSLALMNGKAARLGAPNPPDSVNWQLSATVFVTVPAAQFITIAAAAADHVQATFDALKNLLPKLPESGDGSVATRAAVDSAFAAL